MLPSLDPGSPAGACSVQAVCAAQPSPVRGGQVQVQVHWGKDAALVPGRVVEIDAGAQRAGEPAPGSGSALALAQACPLPGWLAGWVDGWDTPCWRLSRQGRTDCLLPGAASISKPLGLARIASHLTSATSLHREPAAFRSLFVASTLLLVAFTPVVVVDTIYRCAADLAEKEPAPILARDHRRRQANRRQHFV